MKRLSALLVGAFLLVGANSVMAIEGPSIDDPMFNGAAAIAAVRQQVQEVRPEDNRTKCFVAPVSLGEQGHSLENICLKVNSGYNGTMKYELPEVFNTPN